MWHLSKTFNTKMQDFIMILNTKSNAVQRRTVAHASMRQEQPVIAHRVVRFATN